MELKAQSRDSNNNEVVEGAIGAGKNNKSYGDKSVVFGYGNTASWKRDLAIEGLDDFALTPTSVFQFEISSLSEYFRGGGLNMVKWLLWVVITMLMDRNQQL
ncbi:hypothetical protein [Taylorella equigenitalis]|nr:hypothetical protein [Taylorella equigenitalis]